MKQLFISLIPFGELLDAAGGTMCSFSSNVADYAEPAEADLKTTMARVITTGDLLTRLRQGSRKPEPELESQFRLALAEGQRTGLVSVQSGHVKPLCQLGQPEEPRSFSCHLLLLSSDLPDQSPAGTSRRPSIGDPLLVDNGSNQGSDGEMEDYEAEEPCDCQDDRGAPRPKRRRRRSSTGPTRWLRPRNADVTYDEMKLIRQVFSPRELDPEWNVPRGRMTVPGTTQAANGARRSRRRSTTARMQTRSTSRGRQARARTSRNRSRSRGARV
nr:uncharacterized protein LOC115262997 [Aedes albopictus]